MVNAIQSSSGRRIAAEDRRIAAARTAFARQFKADLPEQYGWRLPFTDCRWELQRAAAAIRAAYKADLAKGGVS